MPMLGCKRFISPENKIIVKTCILIMQALTVTLILTIVRDRHDHSNIPPNFIPGKTTTHNNKHTGVYMTTSIDQQDSRTTAMTGQVQNEKPTHTSPQNKVSM